MNNHKLAYLGGGGGLCLRVGVPVVGILIRNDSARILKDLPPTQLCTNLRVMYSDLSVIGCDASTQQHYQKFVHLSVGWAGVITTSLW